MNTTEATEVDQGRMDTITQSGTESGETSQEQEGFFNLLSHVQGARLDDQRCNIQIVHSKGEQDNKNGSPVTPPPEMNNLMDMLVQSQSRRLNDQRAEFIQSPGFPDTMPSSRESHDNGNLKNQP
ncbi:Purkinje cell protein 2 homolog isoform 2-T2 [Rhinophrynus dorsalis]